MYFSERFDINIEHLKFYDILDRKPPIFKKEKHISNIINKYNFFFNRLLHNFSYEIIYKISEYIFYDSKEINLKILDFVFEKDINKKIFEELILINNKNEYISSILFSINYNAIFFHCPTAFEGPDDEIPLNIFNYDFKNKNLIILTNVYCTDINDFEHYFFNIVDNYHNLNNENIIEEIETCFNYKKITSSDEIGYIYLNDGSKNEIIQNNECFVECNINDYICNLIEKKSHVIGDDEMNILIFKNKIVSFDGGWTTLGIVVEEIKDDGYIIAPNYNIHDILKMERWNIEDIIEYNFIIKSRRSLKYIS